MLALRLFARLTIYYVAVTAIVLVALRLFPNLREYMPFGGVEALMSKARPGLEGMIAPNADIGNLRESVYWLVITILGALLTAPAAFAATWGMGRVAMEYFKNPGVSKEVLAQVYRNAKREGKAVFSSEKAGDSRKAPQGNGVQNGKSLEHLLDVELPERLRQKPDLVEEMDAVIHLDIGGSSGLR